jgi:hypothetical protein
MNIITLLRYFGSILAIAGYFIILNVDMYWGIWIRIIADLLVIPWAVKNKLWDVTILLSFFVAIEIHKLITMTLK